MDLIFYVNEHLFIIMIMFARVSGLFLYAPVYSGKFIPAKIKLAICLLFSIILSGTSNYPNNLDLYSLFWCIVLEFIFGTLIGLVSSLFLKCINVFGASVDFMMGFGMMNGVSLDGSSESVSSILIEYLSIILFLFIQGHIHLFYILAEDINIMNLIEQFQSFNFISFFCECFMFIIKNGVNLAIPFLLVFLLIDLCLGVINKSYPNFNVFLFSIPIKSMIFVLLMLFYIFTFTYNFGSLYGSNMDLIDTLFSIFK